MLVLEGVSMRAAFCLILLIGSLAVASPAAAQEKSNNPSAPNLQPPSEALAPDANGAIHLPAMTVPFSLYASPEAKKAFIAQFAEREAAGAKDIAAMRRANDERNAPMLERMNKLYPVKIESVTIGGVRGEAITPADGIAPKNEHRVLINLHGGGFMFGEGSGGRLESIPIASLGKIKVISVFYREWPEATFPAASQDVAAVYKALLADYKPADIGIYGCSAGGILAAQAVAWIAKEGLPRPAAIGSFCGTGAQSYGDSTWLAAPLSGSAAIPPSSGQGMLVIPYLKNADPKDPMLFPIDHPEFAAKFPPTLLIGGTRDPMMSSMLSAQSKLTKAGVDAELHLWDGLWHAFFMNPDLPESKEVYAVTVKFFDRRLGH
jgi:acetyl esterase/lipase